MRDLQNRPLPVDEHGVLDVVDPLIESALERPASIAFCQNGSISTRPSTTFAFGGSNLAFSLYMAAVAFGSPLAYAALNARLACSIAFFGSS